jgi:hypothetical protein
VGKIEALRTHLSANAASVDVQDKPTIGSVSQVEIPHIFKCALINLTTAGSGLASERIAAICYLWHL